LPEDELGLYDVTVTCKDSQGNGVDNYTMDKVLNVVKIELYRDRDDELLGENETYDISQEEVDELFSREPGWPGGKGSFGGPPEDYGMDVFQDPFVLEGVQFNVPQDQRGQITLDLVSTVGDYQEAYTLTEITQADGVFNDTMDSLCIRVIQLPEFNDAVQETATVEVATTVFGVRGEYVLHETAADSSMFTSRHLELDLAIEAGQATAMLADNFGASVGPTVLAETAANEYSNMDGSFTVTIERITNKGAAQFDDLTARVTATAMSVDGVLVDAREDAADSNIFKTSQLSNQGPGLKVSGASAALTAFQELWYAKMQPKPAQDEEAVIIVLRPGPVHKVPKPVKNDPRWLYVLPNNPTLKFMAADGKTNYRFRAVEGYEYFINPPNPFATLETDARGKDFIQIDGLIPGDLVYIAVKGEEDVKHVGVRVLPYTKDELELLIKGCILAKLYEKRTKPYDLYFPEDSDGDGHLDVHEDVDDDGRMDVDEDLDGDGHLDVNEDVNGNGVLDPGEDLDGDGRLDVDEDVDGDGNLDVDEDVDGDGRLDIDEDRDRDGVLDTHVDQWGPFPFVEPMHNLNQQDIATADPFVGGGRYCDFDSTNMIITFGGAPYRIKTGGFAFWVMRLVGFGPVRAYEQNDGMGVRAVDTSQLANPGSRKGSTTLLYEESHPFSQVAGQLYQNPIDVARLLVHEQCHVFQIDKHANQVAYELATYAGVWSNYHHLHDGFLANPRSAAPYMVNDPSSPDFNAYTRGWTQAQWTVFEAQVLGGQYYKYLAYRYLPTEIQAYNVEYDAHEYFTKDPAVQGQMQNEFTTIWQAIFP
jgi:hypothetical protein